MSRDRVNAGTNNSSELLRLAKEKFGNLTKAEERLFITVAMEMVCDYTDGGKENCDPSKAAEWGELREFKADRIRWLCTNPKASEIVETRGILVKGAHIKGKIDLLFGKVLFPLYLEKCALPGGIDLQMAEVKALYLCGSHVGVVEAGGLKVEGDVCLDNGLYSQGGVLLSGAKIGGNLKCDKGLFINSGGITINGDQLSVEGGVLMGNGFESKGEVRFVNAKIKGVFACYGGRFINEGAKALNADSIEVGSNVLMRKGFKANGEVSLIGATIGGNLDCYRGEFINRGATALCADGVKVGGSVLLRDGFKSEGEVRVVGAKIGGDLACNNGHFNNEKSLALSASGINVQGRVFFREGFKAEGEVRLANGSIGIVLDCGNGQFINKGAVALSADGLRVGRDVLFHRGFWADGLVSMQRVIANGSFVWTGIASPTDVTLDLRFAKMGTLCDDQKSWPKNEKLFLDGFIYDKFHENAPKDVKTRLSWLHLQGDKQFRPQPYEQLGEVFRRSGRDEDAKIVLIEKNKKKAHLTQITLSEWFWYRLFGPIIGYGYRPLRSLFFLMIIFVLGWVLFRMGFKAEVITPVTKEAYLSEDSQEICELYPKFCAPMYSLDVLVPLIDLYQSKYWIPNANRNGEVELLTKVNLPIKGSFMRSYLWFQKIMGWILTTLLVLGLTGLVRT